MISHRAAAGQPLLPRPRATPTPLAGSSAAPSRLLLRRTYSPASSLRRPSVTANAASTTTTAPRPDSPLASLASAAASIDPADEGNVCPAFIDRDGEFIEAACCDFGFRTGKGRLYSDDFGQIPKSALGLAIDNFQYEYAALRRSFRENEYGKIAAQNPPKGPLGWLAYKTGEGVVRSFSAIDKWLEDRQVFSRILPVPVPPEVFDAKTGGLSKQCQDLRAKLKQLKLSNEAVWERERERERAGGGVETPLVVQVIYYSLCLFLDVAFNNRPIQRFWFLETVARMPYFSKLSVLHLYESLGWWRAGAELRKVHAAQEIGALCVCVCFFCCARACPAAAAAAAASLTPLSTPTPIR
jgi:ubiquinol oxidase